MIQSGMRVEKIVSEYRTTPTAGWYETSRRRYVWAGWLMLLELDGSNNIVRKYTWGLDLAGQNGAQSSALPEALEAAGGILDNAAQCQGQVGGLLAMQDSMDTAGSGDDVNYVYAYDGNGNVGQVLNWGAVSAFASMKAKYHYDPYGAVSMPMGTYHQRNPFRFSTKYWDEWFGLGYWGYRYYSSRLGRWISRDPIGEEGGLNVYSYIRNRPVASVDPIGLCTRQAPRVYLPRVEKSTGDRIQPALFFGYYLLGLQRHIELSDAVGARIMTRSYDMMNLLDSTIRERLSVGLGFKCGQEQETGRELRGSAYARGAWTDVIGRFQYFGYARCRTQKRCDSRDCSYRVSAYCEFSFDAIDKYDFGPGGGALDDPWAGRVEAALFNVFLLHWTWDPDASGVWECTCNGMPVPGGASGSW